MFWKAGIFASDMSLYQLNVKHSLTVIVFWFSVLEEGTWWGRGRNLL